MKSNILKEAHRIEDDSRASASGHYAAAHRLQRLHWLVGSPVVILTIVAGSLALSPFENFHLVAGIVAIIGAGFATAMLFMNPYDQAHLHLAAANRYQALGNRARFFYEIEGDSPNSAEDYTARITELSMLREDLNSGSPAIFRPAARIVRRSEQEPATPAETGTSSGVPAKSLS